MTAIVQEIEQVMSEIGYGQLVVGKTLKEIMSEIHENLVDLDNINPDEPFEVVKHELKDVFYNRHWVSIDMFLSDAQLERLYSCLAEWKKNEEKI